MASITISGTILNNDYQGWYSSTGSTTGNNNILNLYFDLSDLKNQISTADYKINSVILYMSNNGSGSGSKKSFNFKLKNLNGETSIGVFSSSGTLWKDNDIPIYLTNVTDSFKTWITGNGIVNKDNKTYHEITSTDPDSSRYHTSGNSTYSYNYIRPTKVELYIDYTIYSNSSLTLSSSVLNAATDTTCTITKSNSSYTHTINLVFDKTTYEITNKTIESSVIISSNKIQEIAKEKMKNLQTLQGQIQLQTYSGNESIGVISQNISIFIPDSYKPEIVSYGTVSSNCEIKNRENCLRKDLDILSFTATAKVNLGASVKNYTLKIGGMTYTSKDGSFSIKINTAGRVDLDLTVTDSRGYTSERLTNTTSLPLKKIYVSNYIAPVVKTFSISRSEGGTGTGADGKYEVIISPGYYNNFNNDIFTNNSISSSSIKNGSTNLVTSLMANVEKSFTSSQTYATDTSYEIILSITDTFGSTTTKSIILPSISYLIHFRKNVQSMGIGCAAPSTNNQLDIAWKVNLTGGLAKTLQPTYGGTGHTSLTDLANNTAFTDKFMQPGGSYTENLYLGSIIQVGQTVDCRARIQAADTNLATFSLRDSSASANTLTYIQLQEKQILCSDPLNFSNDDAKKTTISNLGLPQILYGSSTSSVTVENGAILLVPIS